MVPDPSGADPMAAFLRAHRDEIAACWEERVVALPSARSLPRPWLREHVPEMLRCVEEVLDGRAPRHVAPDPVVRHGCQRARLGYGLEEALLEVAILRDAALHIRGTAGVLTGEQAVRLAQAFDPVFMGVVRHYAAEAAGEACEPGPPPH